MSDPSLQPPSPTDADAAGVDRDNPWPGPAAFTETQSAFFFGRDEEIDALFRLVGRDVLTVLYGQSGLGKTSLLQAGLFPCLRQADFVPVYVRLDHDPAAFGLANQVKALMDLEIDAGRLDAPRWEAGDTLWEYFHRKDVEFWTAKNRPAVPVLVFDQFEELFTLGRASEAARARGLAFVDELASLVEGRTPARVREAEDAAARFQFQRPNCKVVLSLREDFLPELDELRPQMHGVGRNRMRIARMSGPAALEVVRRPGAGLLEEGVAERIVRFVAASGFDGSDKLTADGTAGAGGGNGRGAASLASLEVEPALLSVVCRELNAKRRAAGRATITAGLVAGSRREILADFYERGVAGLPSSARDFIEDRLLTRSGYRDNVALENAVGPGGIDRAAIDVLVSRRLLRLEERLGVQRVELTHDVLTEPIRASRDARQQRLALEQAAARERETAEKLRQARRRNRITGAVVAVMAVLTAAAVFAAVFAMRQRSRATQAEAVAHRSAAKAMEAERAAQASAAAVSRSADRLRLTLSATDQQIGHLLGEQGRYVEALPYEARALSPKENPNNVGAIVDSVAFLQNDVRLPVAVLQHSGPVNSAAFSPDGARVVTASGGTARVWDAATGRPLGEPMRHEGTVWSAAFSPDGARVVTASSDNTARVWDAATGRPLGEPMRHENTVNSAAFSPDGARVVTASSDNTARVWEAATGRPLGEPMRHGEGVRSAAFSPDGTRVVTASGDKTARVWEAATGRPLGEPMRHGEGVRSAAFSPDGARVVTASDDKTARVWEAATGRPLGEPMRHEGTVWSAAFSPDGARVVTASVDNTARVWDVFLPIPARQPDDWLLQLDELTAHASFGPAGVIEPLGASWPARLDGLREAVAAPAAEDAALAKAIGWFLTDPRRRTISPLSTETTSEWARRRDDEFTPDSLQAAWEVEPADALCLARRGRNFAVGPDKDLYWADLYSKLAMKQSRASREAAPEAAWRRAAVLAAAGKAGEAADLADHAPAPPEGDAWAWEARWEACLLLHRQADAAAARRTADALAEKMFWYNKKSFDERVKEAEAAAANGPATQPATTPAQ